MARKNFVGELRFYATKDREQVASRIVLESCQDPILRPSVYDSFSDEQKAVIRGYYFQTAMLGHIGASPVFSNELQALAEKAVRDASGNIRDSNPRINLFKTVP